MSANTMKPRLQAKLHPIHRAWQPTTASAVKQSAQPVTWQQKLSIIACLVAVPVIALVSALAVWLIQAVLPAAVVMVLAVWGLAWVCGSERKGG